MNKIQLILLFCIFTSVLSTQQEFVYTIHYVKSYRSDLIDKNVGCQHNHIAYGTYIHPQGNLDALYLIINPGTYNMGRLCNTNRNLYAKLFGTAQKYEELLKTDPSSVANQIARSIGGNMNKFIIDWKCPPSLNYDNSRTWLNKFVQELEKSTNHQVYVKAPASYFCYQKNGIKYLSDLDKPKRYIIEMYGEQAGFYTNYEQIFEKDSKKTFKNKQNYPQNNCPKFPSYQTLVKNFPQKQFYIQKTLQQQQAGYIGNRFGQFLEKGKQIYGKIAFLDSYPQQIIQL